MLMGFANNEGGVYKNLARGLQGMRGQMTGTPYPALLTNDGYPINGAVLTASYTGSFQLPANTLYTDDHVMKLVNVGGAAGGDFQLARGAACQFTGSTSGTTLSVASIDDGGSLAVGSELTGGSLTAGTIITNLGTGTGGTGDYTISISQTRASATMFAIGYTNIAASAGSTVGSLAFNLTMKGTNPRVVFRWGSPVPTGNITFNFMASGTFSGCSKLVICKLSDEAAIDAETTPEELFNPGQITFYQALNCKVFRPMGPAGINFSNNSKHAYRVPWLTGLCYYSERWVPGAWAGTAAGTNTYTCSPPADLPASPAGADGAVIQCQFTNANTATAATINPGGAWGAKSIMDDFANTTLSVGGIAAGALGTLVYDELIDAWMLKSAADDRGKGLTQSVPVEALVGFANACGVDYWHNVHHLYSVADVSACATIIKNQLYAGLGSLWEYSNETWHFNFTQAHHITARGLKLGFPADSNRRLNGYTGLRIRQMWAAVATAFGTRGGLRRVAAFQGFGPDGGTQTYLFNGGDLNGTTYPVYGSYVGVNYDTAPNRPIDFCEVLSYAPYIVGAQTRQVQANYTNDFGDGKRFPDLAIAADDYASGDPVRMTRALAWMDFDIRRGIEQPSGNLGAETLQGHRLGSPGHAAIYPVWNALAAGYTPRKYVECYEGCTAAIEAPDAATCITIGLTGYSTKIANLITAYKQSPLFEQLSWDCWNEFMAQSQSATPAWLGALGNPFGIMGDNIYTATFKSYDAMVRFNHATFGRLR